ncbi:MAG TPA: PilZ domain-containing protein [Thermoanaerobaculia bacterium]
MSGSTVRLRAWILGFKWLHEKARRGTLAPGEEEAYREAREDLAAMLVAAQRLTLGEGEVARGAVRVVRGLPFELRLAAGTVRGRTLDVSEGGFSAVLAPAPRRGEAVAVTLTLASGDLNGQARVMSVVDQDVEFRVSFRLEELPAEAIVRLRSEVLDAALEQLANLIEQS